MLSYVLLCVISDMCFMCISYSCWELLCQHCERYLLQYYQYIFLAGFISKTIEGIYKVSIILHSTTISDLHYQMFIGVCLPFKV